MLLADNQVLTRTGFKVLVDLEDDIEQPTDSIVRIVRFCMCGSNLHP